MKRFVVGLVIVTAACFPTTTRPSFVPLPSAPMTEVALAVPAAMRALALALDGDSIPVRRTETKDGWLETDWFDAATLKASSRRVLGENIVKVRAWADPTRLVGARDPHSSITIETVYRPMDDPSREGRALERQVPPAHPVAQRVAEVLNQLTRQYGDTTRNPPIGLTPAVKKP